MEMLDYFKKINSNVRQYFPPRDDFMKYNVFHYTNIDALESIISHQNLWLTKSDYLNDKEELEHSFKLLSQCYNEGNYRFLERKMINSIIRDIKKSLTHTYIISFSLNKDSMHLWSNYSPLDGYNFELSLEEMFEREWNGRCFFLSNDIDSDGKYKKIYMKRKNDCHSYSGATGKVIYDLQEQRNIISNLLEGLDMLVQAFGIGNYSNECPKGLFTELLQQTYSAIVHYSQLFKNNDFKYEEEYRICYNINHQKRLNIVRFRKSKGTFIPYIIIGYDDEANKGLPIKSISIGPKNTSDLAEKGLKDFIRASGYDVEIKGNKDFIMRSKIKLR